MKNDIIGQKQSAFKCAFADCVCLLHTLQLQSAILFDFNSNTTRNHQFMYIFGALLAVVVCVHMRYILFLNLCNQFDIHRTSFPFLNDFLMNVLFFGQSFRLRIRFLRILRSCMNFGVNESRLQHRIRNNCNFFLLLLLSVAYLLCFTLLPWRFLRGVFARHDIWSRFQGFPLTLNTFTAPKRRRQIRYFNHIHNP